MRHHRYLWALLLLAVLVAGLCAGCGLVPRDLSQKLNEGDQATYHVRQTVAVTMDEITGPPEFTESLPERLEGTFRYEFDAQVTVESVRDGIATVTYAMSGFTGEIAVDGVTAPLDGDVPPFTATVKVNTRNGEVVGILGVPPHTVESNAAGIDQAMLEQLVALTFPQLPERGILSVGAEWELEEPVTAVLPTGERVVGSKTVMKYAANDTVDGLGTARIEISGEAPVEEIMERGLYLVTVTGQLRTTGSQHVNRSTGWRESLVLEMAGDFTQRWEPLGGEPMSMRIQIQVRTEIERQ